MEKGEGQEVIRWCHQS